MIIGKDLEQTIVWSPFKVAKKLEWNANVGVPIVAKLCFIKKKSLNAIWIMDKTFRFECKYRSFLEMKLREQKKREIRLPVVLLAVVCTAKLAMARLARPTARTRGESDMTKVVPYFLKQIYSNKQRIVLKKNSSE